MLVFVWIVGFPDIRSSIRWTHSSSAWLKPPQVSISPRLWTVWCWHGASGECYVIVIMIIIGFIVIMVIGTKIIMMMILIFIYMLYTYTHISCNCGTNIVQWSIWAHVVIVFLISSCLPKQSWPELDHWTTASLAVWRLVLNVKKGAAERSNWTMDTLGDANKI